MKNSNIEWTDHTFNPWRGCTKVSPACDHCYAERLAKRNPETLGVWGPSGTRVIASENMWREPLKWDRESKAEGIRRKVFAGSMCDIFEWETIPHENRSLVNDARLRLFQTIALTPNLDWLLLTKRPENIEKAWPKSVPFPEKYSEAWPNLWLGVTAENQTQADKRIQTLLDIPAKVRFVSCEPLLGPLELTPYLYQAVLHWVIVGGETGAGARPTNPDWVYDLQHECAFYDTPFFFKKWGVHVPLGEGASTVMGETYHEYPGEVKP